MKASFRVVVACLAALAAILSLGLTYADAAAPPRPVYVPKAPTEKVLPHQAILPAHKGDPAPIVRPSIPRRDVRLPGASTAVVDLLGSEGSELITAGDLPVRVGLPGKKVRALTRARSAAEVEVRTLGAAAASKASIPGVLFSVRSLAGDPGPMKVRLDYRKFAHAIGGSWASRMRLVAYPACILTTPRVEACRRSEDLRFNNDAVHKHITSTVQLAPATTAPTASEKPAASTTSDASGTSARETTTATSAGSTTVLAAVAGPGGSEGDFTATSLSPSGSWSQTGSTGGFTWDYPLVMPPAGTGQNVTPGMSLNYNSQAVDGQNNTSNNQSSWVGQGWSYDAGYVERSYRPCADDKSLPDAQQTSDLCWVGPVVTLHMPGGSTAALVQDDTTKEWHATADNGDKIELKTGADNQAWNGEHWVVTTQDGTQYFFGLNRLPGSAAGDATNSAWTVPVYSPRSDDPCYDAAGFGASRCTMAYRWNLDFVKDLHGNASVYSYDIEKNHYSSTAGTGTDRLEYVRGGYLDNIRYGLNTASPGLFADPAPQRVDFAVAERCFPSGTITCSDEQFKVENAQYWPDVPVDQACDQSGTCDNHAPTFWTRKRLTTITTKYLSGTAYQKVDSYALGQHFGTSTDGELLLDSISRTGWKGTESLATEPVTFDMSVRANRVENSHNLPPMYRSRLHTIRTETGQVVSIAYSGDDGQAGRAKPLCTVSTLPTSPSANTSECYPVRWTPPFESEILDYFHKYVVTEVSVGDTIGTAPDRINTYTYVGDPAWHYDDNEVLRPKFRTWAQFRGYAQVETRTGNPNVNINGTADAWTSTKSFFYRGMDGDRLPNDAHRSVTLTDSQGAGHLDKDGFAGQVLETQQFTGVGGALITKTISSPTVVATTATRARGTTLDPVKALIVRPSSATTYTTKAAGGFLTAGTATKYDATGRALEVTSTATGAVTNCVKTTYVDNASTGVHDKASEITTYEATCPTATTPSPTIKRAVRSYYDGSATLGSVTKGDATRTDTAKSGSGASLTWVSESTGYDSYGRATSHTVNNPGATPATRTTTTTYTPAGVGALTKVDTQYALSSHATHRWIDPARGVATSSADVAGLVTDADFDPLGRLTAVWRPGQVKGTDPATETYDYIVGPDRPLSVTTKTLVDRGNGATPSYKTRVVLYDAFGAIRQAQADAVGGGRMVTDNFTDSHGWSVKSYDHWFTTGSAAPTLIGTTESGIDDWKTTTYDGAGRPTLVTGRKGATTVTSTIRTIHGGDRITVIPPAGGVTTTSIVDGRGQKVEFDQYKTAPTVTGNVVSGGTMQRETYTFDSVGQQTQQKTAVGVVGKEATWTTAYDLLGRVTSAVSPDSGNTRTDYYDTGETKTRTDGANRVVAYDYDPLGRPLHRYAGTVGGSELASWTYDTKQVGQLTSSTSNEPGGTFTKTITGYDTAGNPLGTTVSLNATNFNTEYTSTQTWTKTHLLATSTFASTLNGTGGGVNPETLTYSYNNLGLPTQMQGTNAYVSQASYTPYGEASQLVMGVNDQTLALTINRDAKTRLTSDISLTGQLAAPQLEKMSYTYDLAGNLKKLVNVQGSASTGPVQTQCFHYDNLRQLDDAWASTDSCATNPTTLGNNSKVGGPQPYWTTWTYDDAGNRLKQVKHGLGTAASTTTTYAMNTAGHAHALTSASTGTTATSASYTYLADGAMAKRTVGTAQTSFTYGADGSLATVTAGTASSTYSQDADGNIIFRRDPSSSTLYLPGQEVTASTTGALTVHKYYSFNGVNIGIRTNKGAVKYMVADLNGSNQVAVDPVNWTVTRRYLDPFGGSLANKSGTPAPGTLPGTHSFMNQPLNPTTGLVDMGARQYDPTIGRFTSVDPIMLPDDPQQANGYTYADNNPITYTDASGLMLLDGGSGGNTSDASYDQGPKTFVQGVSEGAGAGAQELLQSLNPVDIVNSIKKLISDPPNPWAFVKAVVSSITHFDDFKAVYDAWKDRDSHKAGYHLGKLLVEISGDLIQTILGVKAASALSDALKAGSAAAKVTTEAATIVAKADVPDVVFSRSRAPGIAQNFDDAVANGAPTSLTRVDKATRNANRRAALRGKAPAPAGQSLDEYPFACSAQGGCGSFVQSVPVAEQHYQGGVLSRFFQDNGLGFGDPFNVVFKP